LYRAGTLSGIDRLSTVFYRVFLDDAGAPVSKPGAVAEAQLRLLSEI